METSLQLPRGMPNGKPRLLFRAGAATMPIKPLIHYVLRSVCPIDAEAGK